MSTWSGRRPNGRQRELSVEGRHEPGELQLVQIEVVVVHAKAAAHNRAIADVVRHTDARPEVVEIALHDSGAIEAVLVDDQRLQLRRQVGRHLVIGDLAARRIERAFEVLRFVPRRQVLPAQPQLQRELPRHVPDVVDERRDRRRVIGGSRTAERAGAGRAVAEQEIGHGVARELPVEGEGATRRHLGQVLERAPLRLDPESQVVAPEGLRRRVGDAEDLLGGALGNGALAIAGEAGQVEPRASVVERIGSTGKIAEADVPHPVSTVEADRRGQMVGVVVAEPELVHE